MQTTMAPGALNAVKLILGAPLTDICLVLLCRCPKELAVRRCAAAEYL